MWAPSPSISRNSNLDHFQQTIAATDKDFWPEDGWELLAKDFGLPGGISQATENPFYALYNKYTGKLRVFFLATEKPSDKKANSAAIVIQFDKDNRKTAFFQNLNPISIPLISFSPTYNFLTPNYYATEDLYWLFAEVDIAYDPCTCHLTDDSKIEIQAHIITTSAINATLNGVLDQKVTESGTNGTGTPSASKSLFTIGKYDISDGVKQGQKAYKEWRGYQKEVVKFLKQVDTFVQKNRHLPGIKSAAEYKNVGSINMGELQLSMLQKIEELTLYNIQLMKELEELNRKQTELEQKLLTLKN